MINDYHHIARRFATVKLGLTRRESWVLQVYTVCSACDPAYLKDPADLVLPRVGMPG
jgi:hypothetical protein